MWRIVRAVLKPSLSLSLSLTLVVAAFACSDKKSSDPTTDDRTAEAPPEQPDPKVVPAKLPDGLIKPSVPIAGPDAVYLATDSALLQITGGEFVKVADLPRFFGAADMTFDAAGALWLLGRDSVAKLEGSSFKTFKLSDGNGALKKIAVHGDDNIDVVGVYGISHFDGTGWTLAKTEDLLGPKSGGIQDLVMDGEGRGFAAAFKRLLVREDKLWKALPADDKLYSALDIAADGTLVVATTNSILEAADGSWKLVEVDGCTSVKGLEALARSLVLRCFQSVLTIERGSGATRTTDIGKGGKLDLDMIHASDTDDQGRVYIGAKAGFFVLSPDGAVASFKLGSVPLMESGPRAVLASGAGADKLPGEQAIRFGAIAGKLLKKGKPLASVPVELCTNTSSFIKPGQTPCSEASWKTTGTTGADGSFAFDEVPVGKLQFAYKGGGTDKWTLVIGFDCCSALKEGGKLDVGPIDMM